MSVYVVRIFVQLRALIASNIAISRKFAELEGKLKHHADAITAILSFWQAATIVSQRRFTGSQRRAFAR